MTFGPHNFVQKRSWRRHRHEIMRMPPCGFESKRIREALECAKKNLMRPVPRVPMSMIVFGDTIFIVAKRYIENELASAEAKKQAEWESKSNDILQSIELASKRIDAFSYVTVESREVFENFDMTAGKYKMPITLGAFNFASGVDGE